MSLIESAYLFYNYNESMNASLYPMKFHGGIHAMNCFQKQDNKSPNKYYSSQTSGGNSHHKLCILNKSSNKEKTDYMFEEFS